MTFSPLQIGVTFLSFAITVLLAYWWHKVDKNAEKRESDVESFPVLMSVFFWSAFLAFLLKMLFDLGVYFAPQFMQMEWVFIATLVLEEVVKVFALLVGLNIAGKRFNELSDGIMYAVFAALGFVFFENILYLLSVGPNWAEFFITLLGRNIFSFSAHLSIVLFGLFYASAYLHPHKSLLSKLQKRGEHRVKPYEVCRLLTFLWDKFSWLTIFWLPFSPFILLFQIAHGKRAHISMSEMLIGGFLLTVYTHVFYDLILEMGNKWLNSIVFLIFGLVAVFLFHFFPEVDVIEDME